MGRKAALGIVLTLLLGVMLFSAILSGKGETETHDLGVELEAGPTGPRSGGHHFKFGESRVLNATVWNYGNVTEPEVTLTLLINDSEAVGSTVRNLSSGKSFRVSYDWFPSEIGVYNVTAYAPPITYPENETNTTNNVDSWLINVCDNIAPVVDFTYSPRDPGPVAGENVTFDASASFDPDWGNITTYSWDFNGTIRNATDPVYTYNNFTAYGNATVALTLYDTENKSNTLSNPLRVCARPKANFNVSGDPYIGYTLIFNASSPWSSDDDGYIINYTWNFEDNNITEGAYPVVLHTYNDTGQYNVNLTITDDDNLTASRVRTVLIGSGIPVADFEITQPAPHYVNENLTFDASKSDPRGGTFKNFFWDWDDGTSPDNTTAFVINHTFTQQGNYSVTLTVTDDKGLNGSRTKNVSISLRVCVKVEDAYTGNTTIIYNASETFKVNITVANVENLYSFYFNLTWPQAWMPPEWPDLFDTDSVQVTYGGFLGPKQFPNATVRVEWEPIVRADHGYVVINATLLDNVPYSGNGTLAVIEFTVVTSGNCTLTLSETILSRAFKSIVPIENVSVENGTFLTKNPVARFWADPYGPPVNSSVTFDASGSYDPDSPTNGTNNGIVSYEWDFGDSTTNTTDIPITKHSYNENGTYYVNLTVMDDNGEKWWFRDLPPIKVGESHDIAIVNMSIAPVDSCNGAISIFGINVTLWNGGNVEETFNVTTLYNDSYVINITTVTLSSNASTLLTFSWNVTGFSSDTYVITASAILLDGINDTNPNDNTATYEQKVGLKGDCNGDGTVDILDCIRLGNAFGSKPGDDNWDDPCDLNADDIVDVLDAIIVSDNF